MRAKSRILFALLLCGFSYLKVAAQCPPRPQPGSLVQDALSLYSQNGVLNASFTMGTSVDEFGYTHYCYKYQPSTGSVVEAPTLRLNPGDQLQLNVTDDIVSGGPDSVSTMMDMSAPAGAPICGDGGTPTINS